MILETRRRPGPTGRLRRPPRERLRHQVARACIALHGTLGAGKTTFVRHLLRALGVWGGSEEPAMRSSNRTNCRIGRIWAWTFDFYHFGDPRNQEDAGFRDLFASPGLKLVEWPDKAAGLLPQPGLALTLDLQTDGRRG